jgi:hypothetical protein
MPKDRSPTEKESGKAEDAPIASSDAAEQTSPMDKFKAIARRIVRVPREEYSEAERRYRESRTNKSNKP